MTQKGIIGFEETNTGVIRLYLEGTFYKAYERSAFAFCTRIKDYRVLRKESKTAYDILTQIILISRNIPKNCQTPFGVRMKELSFRTCYILRGLYDVKEEPENHAPMITELVVCTTVNAYTVNDIAATIHNTYNIICVLLSITLFILINMKR